MKTVEVTIKNSKNIRNFAKSKMNNYKIILEANFISNAK
jgi:hypothetical protein